VLDVDALMTVRISASGTLFYLHTFTPRSGAPVAPVELTPHAALAAAAAMHRAPSVPPLEPSGSLDLAVPEIVDWEPYLGDDCDMAFLLGLGV
jgi:hypothetical protein